MLYIDIILLSAWVGYGGRTLYNGGTLGIGYILIGLLTIVAVSYTHLTLPTKRIV